MGLASRNWAKKQALEIEIKDVYAKMTIGTPVPAELTLDTTTPIELVHANTGAPANGGTVTIQVNDPAANPTDTVLADVTGSSDAIVITITPNDGTNNTSTPVDLTTAHLVTLLDTGSYTGVTVTDVGSLLDLIDSASGGDTTPLVKDGEGDGVSGTWAGGDDDMVNNSVVGISEVKRNDVGDYSVILEDAYHDLRNMKAIRLSSSAADIRFQLHSESVNDSDEKEVRFLCLTGATPTDPADGVVILVKLELKNSSAV